MGLRISSPIVVSCALRFVLLLTCFTIASSLVATATVTNVVWYRLGENDPDAAAGNVAANTLSTSLPATLPLSGGPHYSADVAPGLGSLFSMQFSAGQRASNAPMNFTNNFGLECWVKSTNLTGNSIIAYNGHTGTNGWGLFRQGTNYQVLFGGQTIFGTGIAVSNVWTHLALVRDNGTSTLYVNGVAAGTSPVAPAPFALGFGLAAPPQNPAADNLKGWLDEVRVFTFAPGQFSTNDLLLKIVHTTVVTNLADSGPGTLRTILVNAFNGDQITFATNGTITLTSGEIAITKSLQILGPDPALLTINGNNASRIFNITSPTANVLISALTIRDGRAPTVASPDGGGICNTGTLAMNFCEIISNKAFVGGNGPSQTAGNPGGNGGGIFNGGSLTLFGCAFAGNAAGNGGRGGDGAQEGFGVATDAGRGGNGGNGGALANAATAILSDCTFSLNQSGMGGEGGHNDIYFGDGATGGNGGAGAIFNSGSLAAIALTISENIASAGGPGGSGTGSHGGAGQPGAVAGICNLANGKNVTFINSIVAGNVAVTNSDVLGDFTSWGHNLIGQTNSATGFTNGINGDLAGSSTAPLDPQIGPIADNGGPTRTCRLLATSPAFDTGDDALLLSPYSLDVDQRNLPRKFGAHVDIGALESEIIWPPTAAVTTQISPSQDPVFGTWSGTLQGTVNPGGLPTAVYFQFGISVAYGGIAPAGTLPVLNTNVNPISATVSNLVDSRTYHYRVVASNSAGIFTGVDRTFTTAVVQPIPGDIDGNGVVDTSEFQLVQSNYFLNSPWLQMTNVAGLGGTNVTFALTNTPAAFNVEYTTNLTNWYPLGPAAPRFLFTDTNAPGPQRYYRLRWP